MAHKNTHTHTLRHMYAVIHLLLLLFWLRPLYFIVYWHCICKSHPMLAHNKITHRSWLTHSGHCFRFSWLIQRILWINAHSCATFYTNIYSFVCLFVCVCSFWCVKRIQIFYRFESRFLHASLSPFIDWHWAKKIHRFHFDFRFSFLSFYMDIFFQILFCNILAAALFPTTPTIFHPKTCRICYEISHHKTKRIASNWCHAAQQLSFHHYNYST